MNSGLARGLAARRVPGMVKLGSVVVVGSLAQITFEGISQQYGALELWILGRSTAAATQAEILITFNRDTGANYDLQALYCNSTSSNAFNTINAANLDPGPIPGANSPVGHAGQCLVAIHGYSSQTWWKALTGRAWFPSTTGAGNFFNINYDGEWRSTDPIRRIDLNLSTGNWAPGSSVDLYGVNL